VTARHAAASCEIRRCRGKKGERRLAHPRDAGSAASSFSRGSLSLSLSPFLVQDASARPRVARRIRPRHVRPPLGPRRAQVAAWHVLTGPKRRSGVHRAGHGGQGGRGPRLVITRAQYAAGPGCIGGDEPVCAPLKAAADREIARIPVSRTTGLVPSRARARARAYIQND